MHSFASTLGDAIMEDWLHLILILLGICFLEFGFGWASKMVTKTKADHRVLALEKRIGDLQRTVDELRKEKEEMLASELAATKTVLSSFVKEQEELLQKWQNLLVAQETKHRESVERKSFPHETKVPQFIPVNHQQGFNQSINQKGFNFGAQEAEGDPCGEEQVANRPVDREWLQASFAQYMETVGEDDVESGGCPSPDYGVCDRSCD
ncbi:hypothetical protein BSKO_13033 [Bryopsis sp. KO-2023]|nr:hypothetical protein BSKO_13033 [Bryopsis sp. KO-2023]